jgi:hypothetical protein
MKIVIIFYRTYMYSCEQTKWSRRGLKYDLREVQDAKIRKLFDVTLYVYCLPVNKYADNVTAIGHSHKQ